jgi:hypothetical protein
MYNNLSVIEEEVTGHAENGYDKIRMNDSIDLLKIEAPCSPSSAVACYGGWTSCRESPKCKEVFIVIRSLTPQQSTGNALAVHFQTC